MGGEKLERIMERGTESEKIKMGKGGGRKRRVQTYFHFSQRLPQVFILDRAQAFRSSFGVCLPGNINTGSLGGAAAWLKQ